MTATPRTDAVTWRLPQGFEPNEHVPADFARTLERELTIQIVSVDPEKSLADRVLAFERFVIRGAMQRNGGSKAKAARELRMNRRTLDRKLNEK